MLSLDAEISLIAIFLFFIGPAYVFVKTKVSFWNLTNRRHSNNRAPTITSKPPLNDTFTYTTFPFALAATLYITDALRFSPFEAFSTDYMEILITPIWLIKYSIFTGFLTFVAMIYGVSTGLITPALMEIVKPSKNEPPNANGTVDCQCSQQQETRNEPSDE